jgi:arsenate reductase
MSDVEVWHNPRCSKSRAALELVRSRGVEPRIVLYLDEPPDARRLEDVLRLLGLEPRELMRKGEAPYRELGLDAPGLDRAALVRALAEHPILIERPIVIANGRAVVARPPERALEVL